MTIKTTGGKVVTKAGKPSCTCCDGDPPCDLLPIYCVEFVGYDVDGVVSVVDDGTGQFYSVFNEFGTGDLDYPCLLWSDISGRWQVSDGVLITSNTFGGSTDPCDPVGSGYVTSTTPPYAIEATVSETPCTCETDYLEYCVNIDGYSRTVTGSLSSGLFQWVGGLEELTLEWDDINKEWYIFDTTGGGSAASDLLTGSRNRCDPTTGYYTSSFWTTVTITKGACP